MSETILHKKRLLKACRFTFAGKPTVFKYACGSLLLTVYYITKE